MEALGKIKARTRSEDGMKRAPRLDSAGVKRMLARTLLWRKKEVDKVLITEKIMLLREQGQGGLSGKLCAEVREL